MFSTRIATVALATVLAGSTALAGDHHKPGTPLHYQSQTRFQIEPAMIGIPASYEGLEKVTVTSEMNLDCTEKKEYLGKNMRCRVNLPKISWTVPDEKLKSWPAKAQTALDTASLQLSFDGDGALTKVAIEGKSYDPAVHKLVQTIAERSVAGFDIPNSYPTNSKETPWTSGRTALVPQVGPDALARNSLTHAIEKNPESNMRTIKTTGEVAWAEGATVATLDEDTMGKVEADAVWDVDEGCLVRRHWKAEVGNKYAQEGTLSLTRPFDED